MGFADDLNSIAKNSNDRRKDEIDAVDRTIQSDVYRIKTDLTDKVNNGTFDAPVGTRSVSCEWSLVGHYQVDVKRSRIFGDETKYYSMAPKDIDYCKKLQAALEKESIVSTLGFKRYDGPDQVKIYPADYSETYKGYGRYPNNQLGAGELIPWTFYLLCEIKF